MCAIRPLLAATVLAGAIGFLMPAGAAAATTPPGPGPALAEPAPPAPKPATAVVESAIVGAAATESAANETIRPFTFRATDEQLNDLKRRIKATRWPDRELVNDATQGVQLATMRKLADYWAEPI